MTNLFYVSLAYKAVVIQLALSEANYTADHLNLPTPHPIQMADLTQALVSAPKIKNFGARLETTNFYFTFPDGKLFAVVNKEKHMERFDLYPTWAKTPSLINSNGAYQQATQWLAAIDVDVGALEKKYSSQMKIEQMYFWNQPGLGVVHPPGDTNKTMLPIFNVTWGEGGKTEYPVQVRILGTTKELMELHLFDSSFSRRPPLLITNAEELNNIKNPPEMRLQQLTPLQINKNVSTNPPTRPPPFHRETKSP
ncbi:MAG: hypothetical protein WCH99_09810 [Verrucomicrobiota bacterium]